MDTNTIDLTKLKEKFPKTYQLIINNHKEYLSMTKFYARRFLERNGYSICSEPLVHSGIFLPRVTFHSTEVGTGKYFYFNDFEPTTFNKAEATALIFALKEFEKKCV